MILIRFLLVSLIIYLIVRSFLRLGEEDKPSSGRSETDNKSKPNSKKVSKEIGEYVDYEELDK